MKFVSKVIEIEAEVIESVNPSDIFPDKLRVLTSEGSVIHTTSSQPIEVGDFMNVTNPEDMYHMPRKTCVGKDAKYVRIP